MDLILMAKKVRKTLLRRGAHADDVDDLVQEAMTRLIRHQSKAKVRTPEAFLQTVAKHISIDNARRTTQLPVTYPESGYLQQIASLQPTQHDILEARERLLHLKAGLVKLKERTRRILLAKRLDGMSVTEIAEREGMSVAAVEKQISRGTMQLLRWMENQ